MSVYSHEGMGTDKILAVHSNADDIEAPVQVDGSVIPDTSAIPTTILPASGIGHMSQDYIVRDEKR